MGLHRCTGGAIRRGFTLIELLVVFALLAVMLMLAAPGFMSFQRNAELTSSANSFLAALSAARAEAMKRQLRAFVIPGDGSSASTNWAAGWTVFVDVDSNATGAPLPSSADIVISRQAALPGTLTVVISSDAEGFTDGAVRYAMFDGSGFMTRLDKSFNTGVLDLSNSDGTRRVIANPTGRMRVCKPGETGCTGTEVLGS